MSDYVPPSAYDGDPMIEYDYRFRVLIMHLFMDDLEIEQIEKYWFVDDLPERLKDDPNKVRSETLTYVKHEGMLEEWAEKPRILRRILEEIGRTDLSIKVQKLVDKHRGFPHVQTGTSFGGENISCEQRSPSTKSSNHPIQETQTREDKTNQASAIDIGSKLEVWNEDYTVNSLGISSVVVRRTDQKRGKTRLRTSSKSVQTRTREDDGTSFTQSEAPEASSRQLASKMQKLHDAELSDTRHQEVKSPLKFLSKTFSPASEARSSGYLSDPRSSYPLLSTFSSMESILELDGNVSVAPNINCDKDDSKDLTENDDTITGSEQAETQCSTSQPLQVESEDSSNDQFDSFIPRCYQMTRTCAMKHRKFDVDLINRSKSLPTNSHRLHSNILSSTIHPQFHSPNSSTTSLDSTESTVGSQVSLTSLTSDESTEMKFDRCKPEHNDGSMVNSFHWCARNSLTGVEKYYWCAENVAHVPFLDPVSVLQCDYTGCIYKNSDHDIIVKIPRGAISKGKIVHVEVGVTLYGPFDFGERRPVSPILWICPQENVTFLKPIEIVMPHILANLTQKDIEFFGIKFSKADHEDYTASSNNQKKYTFRTIESESHFSSGVNGSFGVIKSDHCCFFCISAIVDHKLTHELAIRKGYCLTCVECTLPNTQLSLHHKNRIYFCVSFMLKSCLKAIKDQYPSEEGHRISHHPYTMKGSHLELHFSDKQKESCSIALKPTKVSHSAIDFWEVWGVDCDQMDLLHKEKMYPPRIEMTVQLKHTVAHDLSVSLKGCEDEIELQFLLPLGSEDVPSNFSPSPNGAYPIPSLFGSVQHKQWHYAPATSDTDPGHEEITMPKLLHVNVGQGCNPINLPREVGVDYWQFGIALLESDASFISSLENEFMKNAERINCHILQVWMDGRGRQPVTWETLVTVLEEIEKSSLAGKIRRAKLSCGSELKYHWRWPHVHSIEMKRKPHPIISQVMIAGHMRVKIKNILNSIASNDQSPLTSEQFPTSSGYHGARYEMSFFPSNFSKNSASLCIDVAKSYLSKKAKQHHIFVEIPAMDISVTLSYADDGSIASGADSREIKSVTLSIDSKKINCQSKAEMHVVASFPQIVSHSELRLSQEKAKSIDICVNMRV